MKRMAVLAAVVLGIVGATAGVVLSANAGRPDKPGPPPSVQGSPPALTPQEPMPASPPGEAVSTHARPSSSTSCPSGWSYFDNPALHYSVCYPPGWGFWLAAPQSAPAGEVDAGSLSDLHLVGPNAFPWKDGLTIADSFATGVIDIEFNLFQRGQSFSRGCTPPSVSSATGPGRSCEYSFELGGAGQPTDAIQVSGRGRLHSRTTLLGLRQTPAIGLPADAVTGSQLLVTTTGSSSRMGQMSRLLSQIVSTVQTY